MNNEITNTIKAYNGTNQNGEQVEGVMSSFHNRFITNTWIMYTPKVHFEILANTFSALVAPKLQLTKKRYIVIAKNIVGTNELLKNS